VRPFYVVGKRESIERARGESVDAVRGVGTLLETGDVVPTALQHPATSCNTLQHALQHTVIEQGDPAPGPIALSGVSTPTVADGAGSWT